MITSFRNFWSDLVDKEHRSELKLFISFDKLPSTDMSSKYILAIPSANPITKSSTTESPSFMNKQLS